jgi:hypothetical protein
MRLACALLFVVWVFPAAAQAPINSAPPGFDSKSWLDDFHQILSEMSVHYANLESAIEDRKMDLPRLKQDTEAELRAAKDEPSARKAIEKFLTSFGDGHLNVHWPKPAPATKPAGDPAPGVCVRLDYVDHRRPGIDFSMSPRFSDMATAESKFFTGGILRLEGGTALGVLRIGLFSEHSFPELCEQAIKDLQLTENAPCDDKCEDRIEIAAANLLTEELAKQADSLRAAGAQAILVDITNNGGGSDWVEPSARTLTQVPLRDARMGFIKHAHWTRQLEDHLHEVQEDLNRHAASPISLSDAAKKIEQAIEQSKQPCDRSSVWETGKLDCSLVVRNVLFSGAQIVDYAKPGTLDSLASKDALFYPSLYRYQEPSKSQPLYVIIDRNTWSAAEYFAAMLQDNHAATVIGELTGGAGCGYTNGGIPAKLKNSGGELAMPDCVRYRADGSNEVNGVTPDVLVPWAQHDSSFQKMQKLMKALEAQNFSASGATH